MLLKISHQTLICCRRRDNKPYVGSGISWQLKRDRIYRYSITLFPVSVNFAEIHLNTQTLFPPFRHKNQRFLGNGILKVIF